MVMALAWGALALYIIGGLLKTPRHCLCVFLAGNAAYIAHYMFMGMDAPAITLGMLSLVTLAIIMVPRQYLLPLVALGFGISATLTLMHMQSHMDLTLIIAAACVYFANYNREHVVRFKLATLLGQMLWVAFALYNADVPMLICAGGMCVSLGVSLLPYAKKFTPNALAQVRP